MLLDDEITTADLSWSADELPEHPGTLPETFIVDPRLPEYAGTLWASYPATGYLLDVVEALPVAGMGAEESLQAIVAIEQVVAHAHAVQARLIAHFATVRPEATQSLCDRYISDELGLALGVSRHASGVKLELAHELTQRLPATLAALHAGRIDVGKARKIADGTTNLTPEQGHAVERHVLQRASDQSHSEVQAAVDRAAIRLDPNGGRKRRERRVREREVHILPGTDGITTLAAVLPSEVASACYDRLCELAKRVKTPDDTRDADQRRADVFADLLLGNNPNDAVQAQIIVTVPYTSLLGMTDEPGELVGNGPLTAEVIREIANRPDSVWRRLLTDPVSGVAKDLGRTRYRPTTGLDEFTRMKAMTCVMPGCRHPAARCDVDHHKAASHGGSTCAHNLGPVCRHHHHMKHAENWTIQQPEPGIYQITTPLGRTYTNRPEPPVRPTSEVDDQPPPF